MSPSSDNGAAAPTRGGLGGLLVVLALGIAAFVPLVFGDAPQDDAYISYRYARNWADGAGLVFNAGEEPVEGYTNFLWTIGIGIGLQAGLDPEIIAPWAGLVFTLLTVLGTYALARRFGATPGFAGLAALLFASRPMLALHAMGGLETSFFGALLVAALWLRWRGETEGHTGNWASAAMFGLAALTRPEGVLFFGLVELFELAPVLRRPAALAAHVGRAVLRGLPLLVLVVAHVTWRRLTYGDWVPNTFHAKVEPSWTTWTDGLDYIVAGLWHFGPLFALAPYVSGAPRRASGPARHARATALWIGVVFLLYVIYAGGDYIPSYRFLWPVMPLWCALVAAALTRWSTDSDGVVKRGLRTALVAGTIALASIHTTIEYRGEHHWAGMDYRHRRLVAAGVRMNEILPPDTWIAVTNAGRIPYFADRPTIDMMGLSDSYIAKETGMRVTTALAGHLKGDGGYVLDRAPGVIVFLRVILMGEPLAEQRNWISLAQQRAFGISEREILADPRFPRAYRVYSIPLPVEGESGPIWLNLFARDEVFGGSLPEGTLVSRRPS